MCCFSKIESDLRNAESEDAEYQDSVVMHQRVTMTEEETLFEGDVLKKVCLY